MGFVANVNAGCIGMHNFQAEIFSLDSSPEILPLLPIHLMPATLDRSPYALHLLLRLAFMVPLGSLKSTWLGPGGETCTISPSGSGHCLFRGPGRHHLHNRHVRSHALLSGRKRSKVLSALAAEPCCGQILTRRDQGAISP